MKRNPFVRYWKSLLLGLLSMTVALGAHAAAGKHITVAFRFDDYWAMGTAQPGIRILNTFLAHRTPITAAVIPYSGKYSREGLSANATEESRKFLKDAVKTGLLEVAQHGFSHQENALAPGQPSSEFSGLPFQEQVDRMRCGKTLLEKTIGRRVLLFIPPWNTYDANTLRAADTCGFKGFSAGGMPGAEARGSTLKFRGGDTALKSLKERVEQLRKSGGKKPVAAVLLHAYDFIEYNDKLGSMTFDKLDELLDWVKAQPDVRVKLLSKTTARAS